jgi:excisionase family DNA binding protein
VTENISKPAADRVHSPDQDQPASCSGPSNPLLSKRDVARWLSVSLRSVDALIATGSLQPYKVGGLRRFAQAEVQRYLEESLSL